MTNRPNNNGCWSFRRPIGQLSSAALQGQVDATNPQRGLHGLRLHGEPLEGHLLGVTRAADGQSAAATTQEHSWPSRLADAYVRGHDLVATYEPDADWPYAPQVYWSADTAGNASSAFASLRLLVSIQTELLDTHPLLDVASELPADEVLHFDVRGNEPSDLQSVADGSPQTIDPRGEMCCLLRRLPGGLSCAETMPASDFLRLTVRHEAGGVCRTQWRLFSEFLEKGVIHRARVGLVFLPRENDVQLAVESCRSFKKRPLPLTT